MSRAKTTFDAGIRDAEVLLKHFDSVKATLSQGEGEVFKRATLILAFTAWETYVEDRVLEAMDDRISRAGKSDFTEFVDRKLKEELKSFHNPNTEKTRKLFRDFLSVGDITKAWTWNNFDSTRAKVTLDELISKRGHAVHHVRVSKTGKSDPHLVTRDDLRKAIVFLTSLVEATEKRLEVAPEKIAP
jgi:RiboL-PSP-HEPN